MPGSRTGALGRTALAVLLALGLALRLGFFLRAASWDPVQQRIVFLQGDAIGYDLIARTMIADHRFAQGHGEPPDALRTPGYPLLVASVYALIGPRPWVVLLVQIGLDLICAVLLGRWVLGRWGPRAAAFAMLTYVLDPVAIQMANSLLSETLFLLMLMLFALALLPGLVGPGARPARVFLAGLAAGVAILVRPAAQFVPLVALPFAAGLGRVRAGAALGRAAAFLGGVAVALLPWVGRNVAVFHRVEINTTGAYRLVLDAAPLEAERRGIPVQAASDSLLAEADALVRRERGRAPADAFEYADALKRVAFARLRGHPGELAKQYAAGAVFSFVNVGTGGLAKMLRLAASGRTVSAHDARSPAALVRVWLARKSRAEIALGLTLGAYLALVYLLVAAGLLTAIHRRRFGRWEWFCLAMVAYFVLVTGAAGEARLRLPATPFYAGWAGLGAAALAARGRAPDQGPAAA